MRFDYFSLGLFVGVLCTVGPETVALCEENLVHMKTILLLLGNWIHPCTEEFIVNKFQEILYIL